MVNINTKHILQKVEMNVTISMSKGQDIIKYKELIVIGYLLIYAVLVILTILFVAGATEKGKRH